MRGQETPKPDFESLLDQMVMDQDGRGIRTTLLESIHDSADVC